MLAQVLIALWDSGFYEYMERHETADMAQTCEELNLDPAIFRSLMDYMVGRGLLAEKDGSVTLTKAGRPYWNYITRGILTAHLGGYNRLLINLGPLLRREIGIDDPRLDRDGRLVASGAGYTLIGSRTIHWILDLIRKEGGKCVLDFGCGAADFLIQLLSHWEEGMAVGMDMSAAAIAQARSNAEAAGVAERISLYCAKLTSEPLPIDKQILDRIDTLTAMYVLHELGGFGGPEAISSTIRQLRDQFPGRTLLMLEGERPDPVALGAHPQRTHAQLDYSFIHPISRQGPLRTPAEWEGIITAAGARLRERVPGFAQIPAWISLYVIEL
jgi:SAM-dependent methyltransferase